jgi:deoxyribodipyrimidine photo-lyase
VDKVIVWFRRDLRLSENPALHHACKDGREVIPVFIWSPEEERPWESGAASKWWLHHSLKQLDQGLREKGSQLILLKGPSLESLRLLMHETRSEAVYWNQIYEPWAVLRDEKIKSSLEHEGLGVYSFNSSLLIEPWNLENSSGKPFQVFTPFWKKLRAEFEPRALLPAPREIRGPKGRVRSCTLEDLALLPKVNWAKGLARKWRPGEKNGKTLLRQFVAKRIADYAELRDRVDLQGTSQLSPYLHFGEIGPLQIWHEVEKALAPQGHLRFKQVESYLRQLAWREFAYHLLFHFPKTPEKPLREKFSKFPWKKKQRYAQRWQKGQTGYPIVDAGMRELWQSGTMHNRARLVAASFLVKDLLQPWQDGAMWFWDTLVDADLANNTLGWQWVSGCGADAAPYFRVFNPILQGEKYDPHGDYVRQWVPELRKLSSKWIHRPWQCPAAILKEAGVVLGKNYPRPVIDHEQARDLALDAYEELA